MHEQAILKLRKLIRQQKYVMTLHAEEEMDNDSLTIEDVETAILTGKIEERQKDHVTGRWKYRIKGTSVSGDDVEVVAKPGSAGNAVIITVYRT